MKSQNIKIALIATRGGHFEQLTNLCDFYELYNHIWITNRNKQTLSYSTSKTKYYVDLAHYKTPWTYLRQIPLFLRIFITEKPTCILSTGSGTIAFIPFILAPIFRIKFIHIDTFSRVYGYSKFASFLLKVGHHIYSQWNTDANPKVTYIGPVFNKVAHVNKDPNSDYIFVTLGTRRKPFTRLISAVEELVSKGIIGQKVIVQAGHTQYYSDHLEIFDFCTPEEISKLIAGAKYVITQESAGIGTKCLKYDTKLLVMPRDYAHKELPVRSDMNEDLHLKLEEMGYTIVVNDSFELEKAISRLESLKTGFRFDNRLAITELTKAMEKS